MDSIYEAFYTDIKKHIPENQLYTDYIKTLTYGTDASFYRLIPKIVIKAESEKEIQYIIKYANKHKVAITYRAAGTSLSGQAVTDSILVILGDSWDKAEVLNNGLQIKLKPGVIGSKANALLKKFARKIGPDPASINTAKIGGIVANNSSGMCCGTKQNTYHTLKNIRIILMDGTILDTSDNQSIKDFEKNHSELLNKINNLSLEIKSNPELKQKIQHKYRLKNTTGYGINSLLDFENPLDMISHLFIGSEGTLGFISEVTYNTVTDHKYKASALILFDNLERCCLSVTSLRNSQNVDAVELIDSRSIKAIQDKKDLPDFMYNEVSKQTTVLLIEVRGEDNQELQEKINNVNNIIKNFNPNNHSGFSNDVKIYSKYWQVRSGLFPAVGAVRAVGTTAIIEDIAFPIEHLAEGVLDLNKLFEKYNYSEALIFGHALEGNLHFVFTQSFENQEEVKRYDEFMTEVNNLVVNKFNGSLKAEHGTGRNVAPFVKKEWGDAAYKIMCDIKNIFDPENILNPDVIITKNQKLHIENLKVLHKADDIVDKCIECGYCEPVCPSSELSLSPRQRIVTWRRIQELKRSNPNSEELQFLEKQYSYMGIETCAATSMCATKCPVNIDTGILMKKLKGKPKHSKVLKLVADNFSTALKVGHFGLSILDSTKKIIGNNSLEKISKSLNNSISTPYIPSEGIPKAANKIDYNNINKLKSDKKVVYWISCINKVMGEGNDKKDNIAYYTTTLLEKAGFEVLFPKEKVSLCCGQPFASQNEDEIANSMLGKLNQALLETSENGKIPVYLDNSSCSIQIIEAQKKGIISKEIKLYDSVSFLHDFVIKNIEFTNKKDKLTLHIPCSSTKLGVNEKLTNLSQLCTNELIIPDIMCCGFAGIKGFSTPELNANSLRKLKEEVPADCHNGVSTSRMCQIGLSHHSGINYKSIECILFEAL